MLISSQPSVLEVKPAPASSTTPSILQPHPFEVTSQVPMQHLVPQWLELQHPPLVHEDSSPLCSLSFALFTPTSVNPRSHQVRAQSRHHSGSGISTRQCLGHHSHPSRKLWRKNEQISNDRNDVTMQGKTFDFAQLFQLVQYKLHAARLVFDPGGLHSVQQSPHEDAHEHKPKTHNTARTLLSSHATTFVTCV
jgi:hypothetical protein